jgi:hypothetical protein
MLQFHIFERKKIFKVFFLPKTPLILTQTVVSNNPSLPVEHLKTFFHCLLPGANVIKHFTDVIYEFLL